MTHHGNCYINGQWTDSVGGRLHTVVNPATEQPVSEVMLGSAADVDAAVKAADKATLESLKAAGVTAWQAMGKDPAPWDSALRFVD